MSLRPDWLASARPRALAIRFSIQTIFPEDRVRVQRLRLRPDWSRLHSELIQLVPAGYRRHSITLLGSNRQAVCSALSVWCRLVHSFVAGVCFPLPRPVPTSVLGSAPHEIAAN